VHTERPRARRYPFVLAFRCDKNAGVPSMIRHLGAAIHRAEVGIILRLSKMPTGSKTRAWWCLLRAPTNAPLATLHGSGV